MLTVALFNEICEYIATVHYYREYSELLT